MHERIAPKRPPGRPRSGKMWAVSSVRLEIPLWLRIDALAEKRRSSRNAVLVKAVTQGVESLEADA